MKKEKLNAITGILIILLAILWAILFALKLSEKEVPEPILIYYESVETKQLYDGLRKVEFVKPPEQTYLERLKINSFGYPVETKINTPDAKIPFDPLQEFSQSDIDIIARVVMSEASIEPYECKVLVAKTVLSRYYSTDREFPNTIEEVVSGIQFSTADNGLVTEECYQAIEDAMLLDIEIFYFRTNYYHSFGTPCKCVGITYFSTE